MTESLSSPEEPRTRFASIRDEVLYRLSTSEWDCASSGSTDSPSGWFAKISNSTHELGDLQDALGESFESLGIADPVELVGHFLLLEDYQGFVTVNQFANEDQLSGVYDVLEEIYVAWNAAP